MSEMVTWEVPNSSSSELLRTPYLLEPSPGDVVIGGRNGTTCQIGDCMFGGQEVRLLGSPESASSMNPRIVFLGPLTHAEYPVIQPSSGSTCAAS